MIYMMEEWSTDKILGLMCTGKWLMLFIIGPWYLDYTAVFPQK